MQIEYYLKNNLKNYIQKFGGLTKGLTFAVPKKYWDIEKIEGEKREVEIGGIILEYVYFFSKKFAYNKNINYLCGPLRSRSNFRS